MKLNKYYLIITKRTGKISTRFEFDFKVCKYSEIFLKRLQNLIFGLENVLLLSFEIFIFAKSKSS